MDFKKYGPIFSVILIAAAAYLVHKLFFLLDGANPKFQNFHTSLESVYAFFLLCSTAIIFILIQVKMRNAQQVGYTFMLLTTLKMGIAYAFFKPILHSGNSNLQIEKINFFFVFAIFLTIETLVAIRILNNKQ